VTEAGNDPKVAGLVYIAAFAPDGGESIQSLIQNPPPGAPVPPILPLQHGSLFLYRSKFAASFAADANPDLATFMAPIPRYPGACRPSPGQSASRRGSPSRAIARVSTEDKMIPPRAQRAMSKRAGSKVVETKGSHAVYVSQPEAVAPLIEEAAIGSASTGKAAASQR
jgi:pimeloyl-ACP methyl ester carboxylesterase